jgi:hypothetical protein
MLREEIKALTRTSPAELRKFGLTVGGLLVALGLFFLWRNKSWWPWLLWPGVPLVLLGAALPRTLKWVNVAWMTLALCLGTLVSTVLLAALFYLVVTPIGLVARLAGKDFLTRKLNPGATSYWLRRDHSRRKEKHEHERQY